MIGIITQNNTLAQILENILSEVPAEIWKQGQDYTALLVANPVPVGVLDGQCPVIALGCHPGEETLFVKTPVAPEKLLQIVRDFYLDHQDDIIFENTTFLFHSRPRQLIIKKNNTVIPLTEKETLLLCQLAKSAPNLVSKESLLESVWHYRPDTETHTVESHIYALRQKIGPKADSLLATVVNAENGNTGYSLLTD